jgi:hypothetical protein
MWAYDEIVGVHFMGETFPGLNSAPPRNVDNRTIGQIPATFRRGFVLARDRWTIPSGRARIFVSLNRTGTIEATLTLSHPLGAEAGPIVVRWNDRVVARAASSFHEIRVSWKTRDLERGINLLEIDCPPRTIARTFELTGRK